jgi:hypothetical protein
VYLSLEEVMVH